MKANDTFESCLWIRCFFLFISWKGKRTVKAKETGVEIKLILGGKVKWQYYFIFVAKKKDKVSDWAYKEENGECG